MASRDQPYPQYELSTEILGHSADVRAVLAVPAAVVTTAGAREGIVTASRDGTACVWSPEPAPGRDYLQHKVMRQHTGYVSALCVIPADPAAGRAQRECCMVPCGCISNQRTLVVRFTIEYRRRAVPGEMTGSPSLQINHRYT